MLDTKLDMMTVATKEVERLAKEILDNLDDFNGYDELFTIERLADEIIRKADNIKTYTLNAYDELEED